MHLTSPALHPQEEDAAAKAAAEAAEAERVARLREEYEAAIPDEVKDQVAAALDVELVSPPGGRGGEKEERETLKHNIGACGVPGE